MLISTGIYPACAQQIITNFPTPNGLGLCAVNPNLNKIYFASGNPGAEQMVVVDGATYSQTTVGNGDDVCVDVTSDNYWSAGVYSDSLTAWNSNNVAQASPSTGSGCAIAVSMDAPHRRVWTSVQCSDGIWVFNADTYATVAGPISVGGVGGNIFVNPATGTGYFENSSGSQRVDPSTFTVTANAFGQVIGANVSTGYLYAQANGNTLQIINGATYPEVVLTNVTLPYNFGNYIGVNPLLNRIYVGYNATNIVAVLNGTTGQAIATISLTNGVTSIGKIVVDSSRNLVYVNAYTSGSPLAYVIQDAEATILTNIVLAGSGGLPRVDSAENEVYLQANNQALVINGSTFSVNDVTSCWDVDVDVTNNNYWTVGQYSTSANVWSSANSFLGSVSLNDCPIGISMDSPHRVVWVSAQCGGGSDPVWAINADNDTVIAGPIGSGADGIGPVVVNPATDRLYINAANAGSERVNPAASYALTANAFGIVMGANASANLLYAYNNNNTTLQIINGAPNPEVVITNVTLPFAAGSFIGVNPALNHIYVGDTSSNLLAVLNATNGALIQTISLPAGITYVGSVGVDATRSRAYVNASGGGASYLYVIQDFGPAYVTNITVTPANPDIGAGTNLQFTATGQFSDGSSQSLTNAGQVTWTSGSPGVAGITANGLATGLSLGTSVISASSAGISGSTLLTVVILPIISTNPMNATVSSGGSVTLSVSANGGALTYQWAFDGTNISGATGSSLTITNVSAANTGEYTVTVSNVAGSATSLTATLASVNIEMFAGVIVNGPLGSNYLIQATSNLLSNWTTLTNVALPSQPYIYIDYSSPTNRQQYYRVLPQ